MWAGYFSISENTLKSTFKSEFLEMLGEQRETDEYLHKTRDELAVTARELAATAHALDAKTAELEEASQVGGCVQVEFS